jgi:hypothetical protein
LEEWQRVFVRQALEQMIGGEQFNEAYAAWAATHPALSRGVARGQIIDGNFLNAVVQDDPGFGWRLMPVPNVTASIDPEGPSPDSRSIRLQLGGDSPADSQLLRQLIIVDPHTSYRLTFVARSQDLVTGGLPVIKVLSASNRNPRVLGQSESLASGSSSWTKQNFDFSTDDTGAIVVSVQRHGCTQSPCPIFGKIWLSSFSLVRN